MNFFMGLKKFCRLNNLSEIQGKYLFDQIHEACPAIRQLLRKVQNQLASKGYVQDPFGHIYSGDPERAYKIVAYFIQGCGTGSIPKAMARAIYDVLHPTGEKPLGILNGITHDEIAFRLRINVSDATFLETLKGCLYCCDSLRDGPARSFCKLFDGIPLRAKMKLSVTNIADAKSIDHYQLTDAEWEDKVLTYVNLARKQI
jgi:hypothetical protein